MMSKITYYFNINPETGAVQVNRAGLPEKVITFLYAIRKYLQVYAFNFSRFNFEDCSLWIGVNNFNQSSYYRYYVRYFDNATVK